MENKYIKYQIDFYNNETTKWIPISFSSFYKDFIKDEKYDKEIIKSYLCAIDLLYKEISSDLKPKYFVMTIKPIIPFLYLCRHVIELSLKYAIRKNTRLNIHNLSELWIKYKNIYNNNFEFEGLIETFNILDKDGTKFRYSRDRNGFANENNPIFINLENIYFDIKKLSNTLLMI